MKASFADLRRKSGEILRALERNEQVTVFYRGHPKAVMQRIPAGSKRPAVRAREHPAFGLWAGRDDLKDVATHVRGLRRARLRGL